MLKFRPIAPKPPGGAPSPDAPEDQRIKTTKRQKRKYVRVKRRTTQSTPKSPPPEKSGVENDESPPHNNGLVTLQLLPDIGSDSMMSQLTVNGEITPDSSRSVASRSFRSTTTTETRVVVECVTDTDTQGGALGLLGFSDNEKIKSLEVDTCPGFVSDGNNNVVWVNEAYRKMAAGDEEGGGGVVVWLVVKEKLLPYFCPWFACRVRVIQHNREGQKWNRIMACDVWRMEFGGFAWRLDVDTSLGLGI